MDDKKYIAQYPILLQTSGLSYGMIGAWDQLQRQYHTNGFTAIEVKSSDPEQIYWQCYLKQNKQSKSSFLGIGSKKNNSYDILNKELKESFTTTDSKGNQSYWNQLAKKLNWVGFFVPIEEIKRFNKNELEAHFAFLNALKNQFPYIDFLKYTFRKKYEKEWENIPTGIIAAWEFYTAYCSFLKTMLKEEPYLFRLIEGWFSELFTIADFQEKLPSEQMVALLFLSCERFYWKQTAAPKFEKLLEKALPTVQTFFTTNEKILLSAAEKGYGGGPRTVSAPNQNELRKAFYTICQEDKRKLSIQECLDNHSGLNFIQLLPPDIQEKIGANSKKTLGNLVKSAIGNTSILDRIQAVAEKVQAKPQPNYRPPEKMFIEKSAAKWYELSQEEQTEIEAAIEQSLNQEQQNRLRRSITDRWLIHLENLGNKITAPVIFWEANEAGFFPKWNIKNKVDALGWEVAFTQKRAKEQAELQKLADLIGQLYKLNSLIAINRFIKSAPRFTFVHIQEKWDVEVLTFKTTIANRSNYRIRRMRAFGILGANEKVDYRKEIYLDEMLQIEEEVKPYILFVKKAFQTALPVRRKVTFDPYRHSHDGIEFDPSTIQDQDKWLRANVMKSMIHHIDRGEIEQINTFCLDFSGSMEHDRMRNLFKILYLLILGLEDRKSFDAVHFFGTKFMETANFTNKYTDRGLLFKVLKKISTITKNKVLYGGMGGTNISDGVANCHRGILEFANKIKEADEAANIVCSLFVITDGEPTLGITDLEELSEFVETKRQDGDVAIKAIYIRSEADEELDFIPIIFGENNYIENVDFTEAVNNFVAIMTQTYKNQRREFKWKKKRKKLKG